MTEKKKRKMEFPEIDDDIDLIEGLSAALNITLKMLINKVSEKDFSRKDMAAVAVSTYLAKVAEARLRGVVDLSLASEIAATTLNSALKRD